LVRLERNKILLTIFLLCFFSSCRIFEASKKDLTINTEVACKNLGMKFLIRDVDKTDFWQALETFHYDKIARGTEENYTVLIFRDRSSMQIQNIKSEDMMQCVARDILWSEVDKNYYIVIY